MAMHPSGKFLYTSDGTTVSEFGINATTGALTAAGQFSARYSVMVTQRSPPMGNSFSWARAGLAFWPTQLIKLQER
jgi:hypothetical protein